MEKIKTTCYKSPIGDMIIGSYGDKICICDWIIENRRKTIDRRICRLLGAEYEEGISDIINKPSCNLTSISKESEKNSPYRWYLAEPIFNAKYGLN